MDPASIGTGSILF